MQLQASTTDEAWAMAQAIASAFNFADYRCECGAGVWSVLTRDWVICDVCEMAISARQVLAVGLADPDRSIGMTVVELPDLGRLVP